MHVATPRGLSDITHSCHGTSRLLDASAFSAARVGERGQNLSGGQRQNVAPARALLLNPPILLLDEPTSAMDNILGEERLKQRLQAVIENKTVILVTHRASLLSLVDRSAA